MRILGMNAALACSIAARCTSLALCECVAVRAEPAWSSAPAYEYPYVAPAQYVLITPG